MKLPKGWKCETVGDLCDFSNGHGFGPHNWSKVGLPIIRIQNLNGEADFNYFNGRADADWLVEPGTLLFGNKGEINDYCSIFGLKTPEQVLPTINLLGIKKRHANKQPCPCGCGLRLGKCRLHYRLNEFRKLECRTYYRSLASRLR